MDQILNPFDKINPFDQSNYFQFGTLISQIKDKKRLLEIGKLLQKRLKELK
tara:strand:+ start:828 stop:980 length:153 start_codon:yes stop_codon:yes gene_type:complete